jgi:hypothetical protein
MHYDILSGTPERLEKSSFVVGAAQYKIVVIE